MMSDITIVGLGSGGARLLTREAWQVLCAADKVYVRTVRHPSVHELPDDIVVQSFDVIYESVESPEDVYPIIATRVLELAESSGGVVYAVPGDPTIAEVSVDLIREQASERGLTIRIVSGLSFVEPTLSALGIDALPRLYLADAFEIAAFHHPPFSPDTPVLLAQLCGESLASDVKLTLMNQYPDEYEVALVHSAGTKDVIVEWMPLHAIDHSAHIADLTSMYVPAMSQTSGFPALQEIVAHLRAPYGCAWDREQTHRSLRANLLEETYEVIAAIDAGDASGLEEELGDMLLQIVLQTQIGIDEGHFQMSEVIGGIVSKLERRHPHVFSDLHLDGIGEVIHNWELIKESERLENGPSDVVQGVFSGVPISLPSLAQAQAYQARASRIGFDWRDVSGVVAKVREEIGEVQQATDSADQEDEIGDLLFAVVNWARWLEVDPESALREANSRFRERFASLEAAAHAQGINLSDASLREKNFLWERAKEDQRNHPSHPRDQ